MEKGREEDRDRDDKIGSRNRQDRSIWSCAETKQNGKQKRDDLSPLRGTTGFVNYDDDIISLALYWGA